ncbi:MAG: peptide ABC transporter substrate-binding protein [Candidatus Lambdaproteobacteria bacterium]|nr:peptide ABC transporter substrate-binding protein [Candidatus Lambdaproteobacteria bacterium]
MIRAKNTVAMVTALLWLQLWASGAAAQKFGGTLVALHQEQPQSLSAHENTSISAVFIYMPMYNNLALYDPLKAKESIETILPELGSSWSWGEGGKAVTFKLREGVKWHDGKPFTAADVKYTFDLVRGASKTRLKLNPRRGWYANVQEIITNGDHEVTFKLKHPQPALLALLAAGHSVVYPAHVPLADLRTGAMGTGPFKLKRLDPEKSIDLERNPDYWFKNRPYLDGVRYVIIRNRGSRTAALQANQADLSFPYDITDAIHQQLSAAVPTLVMDKNSSNVSSNLLMNTSKPPFNDVRLRRVAALALDRQALIKGAFKGLGVAGGAMLPQPLGVWGLSAEDLRQVPGMGDPAQEREKARAIMRELGYGPGNPLRITVSTRAVSSYVDVAIWVVEQLQHVWIDATLEQVESGRWNGQRSRMEYTLAANLTGAAADEPDVVFFEGYACDSPRNYSRYCNRALEQKFVEQSAEMDPAKRLKLVHEIDLQLQEDGARPMLRHAVGYTAYYPYVKNFLTHQVLYSNYRFQELWLDKP